METIIEALARALSWSPWATVGGCALLGGLLSAYIAYSAKRYARKHGIDINKPMRIEGDKVVNYDKEV